MFRDNPYTVVGIHGTYLCENENKYKKTMKNCGCASHPRNTYGNGWQKRAYSFC